MEGRTRIIIQEGAPHHTDPRMPPLAPIRHAGDIATWTEGLFCGAEADLKLSSKLESLRIPGLSAMYYALSPQRLSLPRLQGFLLRMRSVSQGEGWEGEARPEEYVGLFDGP